MPHVVFLGDYPNALDGQDLSGFLKMGCTATIRSYVVGRVGPKSSGNS